jgi:hypothetical protein
MAEVFISFATEDQRVGEAVQREIENRLSLREQVFMSSDHRQLAAGEDWIDRIKREISACEGMVLLLSSRGVRRPWVNFEADAAWAAGKPLIPVRSGFAPLRSCAAMPTGGDQRNGGQSGSPRRSRTRMALSHRNAPLKHLR